MIQLKEKQLILKADKDSQFAQELKKYFQEKFDEIKAVNTESGITICRLLSQNADEIIDHIYSQVKECYGFNSKVAIIALGSYGRDELNPFSDIDILFLYPDEKDKKAIELITRILYILWDIKFTLGHSTRTIQNTIKMAAADITFKTSLVHQRSICGDAGLYKQFNEAVLTIFNKGRYTFYHDLLTNMKWSEKLLGETVLRKEPKLKESLGTLRGIHLIRWLSYNFFQNNTLEFLHSYNTIDHECWQRIETNLDYLLNVRNKLHFLVNRKEDVLNLEHQEELAQNIELTEDDLEGRRRDPAVIKIERYMREFYQRSKQVYRFVIIVLDHFDREANKYRQFARLFNKRKFIDANFMIINNRIFFKQKLPELEADPIMIVRIFLYVANYNCKLSYELEKYIKLNLHRIDDDFRADPRAFTLLKEILGYERNLYHTLSTMHHAGFLSQYLPFFSELECTVQHDYYHAYTVDEHTFQGVKKIEDLYHTNDANYYFLKNVLQSFDKDKRILLIMAILYHDIGKGRPGNHVKNGEEMIDYMVTIFPFTEKEKEMLIFLVNEHMLMAKIAMRRDISDLKVIYYFTNQVQDKVRLDILLLLTYADMSSVSPNVYTLWKGELLKELYKKSYTLLEETPNGKLPVIQPDDLLKIREKIRENIPEEDREFEKKFFKQIANRFYIDNEVDEILSTIAILKEANSKPIIHYEKVLDYYRLKMMGKDALGLFARIALVLAMHGINIHSANLYSERNGYAVNYFNVGSIYYSDEISEARWNNIIRDLVKYQDGEIETVAKLYTKKKQNLPAPKKQLYIPKTRVIFDNKLSEQFSVIEVHTRDKLGLLYRICMILSNHHVNIKLAFIHTYGNKAVDTFYVENVDGGKITDPELIETIKDSFIHELAERKKYERR